jgi:hypothetical protein
MLKPISKFPAPIRLVLIFVSMMFLVAGCGPGQGNLRGKVTYKGKTLAMGSVVVAGSDGAVKSGEINSEGDYEVKGIATGSIKITVSSPDPGAAEFHPRKMDAKPPPPKDRTGWIAIPENYNDFNKSGLTFELRRGPNSHDIDLK